MPHDTANQPASKSDERRLFVFLLVFLFPLLSVLIVAGYGFAVWISQLVLFGPPGPPS